MVELIIYQQNLHKSLIPTQELLINSGFNDFQDDGSNQIKILCVQESNVNQHRIRGFGISNNIYSGQSANVTPRAAIVTSHPYVLLITQHCSPDCVVICVSYGNVDLYICNVYFDPLCDFTNALMVLQGIYDSFKDKLFLFTGDINAKHTAWHSPVCDSKGNNFYDFCCSNNLVILNNSDVPTYFRCNAYSFVDVTVCSQSLLPFISDWCVSDIPNHSDHRMLVTKIVSVVPSLSFSNNIYLTRRYKTTNVKWNHFEHAAKFAFTSVADNLRCSSTPNCVNACIEDFTYIAQRLSESHLPKLSQRRVKNYWWNSELAIKRKYFLACFRRFTRTKCGLLKGVYENAYKNAKAQYRRAMYEAKLNSWRHFCSLQTKLNPWNVVYKICRKPENYNETLHTIKTDIGFTKTALETAKVLANSFFPADDVDNTTQEVIRNNVHTPPNSIVDEPFSQHEVNSIIIAYRRESVITPLVNAGRR